MIIRPHQKLITRKMWLYLFISVVIMFIHKVESFYTYEWILSPFYNKVVAIADSEGEAAFITLVILVFGIFVTALMLLKGGNWPLVWLSIYGFMFFIEIHHTIKAIIFENYYSGLYTAWIFSLFGIFYWKELIHNYRLKARLNRRHI